ncbi:hypothetical protein BHO_0900087 (plasmid) [Borrelia hermsii YBT]|uniref:Uncharacterized protein n=1 Tax=Borrelia hermsii YBT TaxID=1313295 RepID=W5T2U6_BORHE|nr:hypothetical protein BHO_0900087 [Borrelia hermsii YBT]
MPQLKGGDRKNNLALSPNPNVSLINMNIQIDTPPVEIRQ